MHLLLKANTLDYNLMNQELFVYWEQILNNQGVHFEDSNNKFLRTLKFGTQDCLNKVFINEEESYFILVSMIDFPKNNSHIHIKKGLLVARLNSVIKIGQFSWKRKNVDKKILIYKTSQYLIRRRDNRKFVLDHLSKHLDLLESVKNIIENSKELNLTTEFDNL